MTPPLQGKRGLVVGIANEHSIAWGCARAFRDAGAEVAVTWLNDKARPHVEPLAEQLQAPIRAPLDGTVLQVNARAGEIAAPQATQPLVLLGDMSALRVRAELDQRDLDKIKVGQQAVVRSDAFRGRDIAGKVASIAPLVESSRTAALSQRNMTDVDVVEVLVDLAEPGPFAVGMKVDVYFRP